MKPAERQHRIRLVAPRQAECGAACEFEHFEQLRLDEDRIERRESARDGEIVVALLDDGQATLKRYFKERGRVRLQPANSTMSPIYVDKDIRIQGVLIGVLRTYAKTPGAGRGSNN